MVSGCSSQLLLFSPGFGSGHPFPNWTLVPAKACWSWSPDKTIRPETPDTRLEPEPETVSLERESTQEYGWTNDLRERPRERQPWPCDE